MTLKNPIEDNFLRKYESSIGKTDKFLKNDFTPILMGLYGEVGSIMSTSKKFYREKTAFSGHKAAVEEEFGDAFWYLSALCRRLSISIESIFDNTCNIIFADKNPSGSDKTKSSVSKELDAALINLGYAVAKLLSGKDDIIFLRNETPNISRLYCEALTQTGLDFRQIVEGNLIKALGRFTDPDPRSLEDFDANFPEHEQLPQNFEIHISQRNSGLCYLRWNGVFIGDPLTDNIWRPDGYRFHDVFHMAHAAILHWSPTFRALIKKKRKSDPAIDRDQDGGRAIVVEEGLTAWLFSYAQDLDNFRDHNSVSFDALKIIQKFVQGYEVERCPLKLWEDAILQGYNVFRQLKENSGGVVIGDRKKRIISYRPIGEE